MVKNKSNTRLSSLEVSVVLTQTDTTVGFLSQNDKKLYEIKFRNTTKPFIKVYSDFKTLLTSGIRVPNKFKNTLRRSKKTTFIVKNIAFRVAEPSLNSQILRNLRWNFSTSANESTKKFNRVFCEKKADIIIENNDRLHEYTSSSLIKIGNITRRKIR